MKYLAPLFRQRLQLNPSFRPKEDNPPELNEFLTNVLDHRNEFSYIRDAAKRYQKMKKDTQDMYGLDLLNQPTNFRTVFLM
ncbi:hypothetical protein BDFB_008353 [Asbolus verrucosus]|uniref:Uncharacterized protein n=1 Tax=Asbolus verrucosus TaxID=1661398 RepID=A0A482VIP5_ASBVE|nr:hypothetical protein BDFB_008353 [Asbolus verrucosus]